MAPEPFLTPVSLAFLVCSAAAASTLLGWLFVVKAVPSSPRLLAFGLAFSGGAMVYVSLVEIFSKSERAFAQVFPDKMAYTWATLSFFAGVALLAVIDRLIPHPHEGMDEDHAARASSTYRVGLLAAAAITAHNFPEGAATFFSILDDPIVGLPLALAIAIHNIPEGVSIAVPVYCATGSRKKALVATLVSAVAEPIGALLTYISLSPFLTQEVFGIMFGIIAGIMVFLALDELMPEAKRYSVGHEAVYGMVIGMSALAVSLVLFK